MAADAYFGFRLADGDAVVLAFDDLAADRPGRLLLPVPAERAGLPAGELDWGYLGETAGTLALARAVVLDHLDLAGEAAPGEIVGLAGGFARRALALLPRAAWSLRKGDVGEHLLAVLLAAERGGDGGPHPALSRRWVSA